MLEKVRNDIDGVVLAHDLGMAERARLIKIVTGAVAGNRDRALFNLGWKIVRWLDEQADVVAAGIELAFSLLAIEEDARAGLTRLDIAVLDFLISMDGFSHADAVGEALALLGKNATDKHVRDCANGLQRQLYAYRIQYLPREKRRQQFTELLRFLQDQPHAATGDNLQDGMALKFWCEKASGQKWTLYQTVFHAMQALKQAQHIERVASDVRPVEKISDEISEMPIQWENAETDIELGGDLAEVLSKALERISSASLQIFKKTELEAFEQIVQLESFGIIWIRSCAVYLSLSPHQASIVQLKRDKAGYGQLMIRAECLDGDDYDAVMGRFERLLILLDEVRCLRFIFNDDHDVHQMAPELSSYVDRFSKRNCSLLRRKEIRNMSPKQIGSAMVEIYDDIELLVRHIERLLLAWQKLFGDNSAAAFRNDRQKFSLKLKTLYGVANDQC